MELHGTYVLRLWCPDCREAKRFLAKYNIPFKEVDIDNTPGAADEVVKQTGKRAIPQFVIDGEWVQPYRAPRGFPLRRDVGPPGNRESPDFLRSRPLMPPVRQPPYIPFSTVENPRLTGEDSTPKSAALCRKLGSKEDLGRLRTTARHSWPIPRSTILHPTTRDPGQFRCLSRSARFRELAADDSGCAWEWFCLSVR